MWSPHPLVVSALAAAQILAILAISAYAVHQGVLAFLFLRGRFMARREKPFVGSEAPPHIPSVTIQLPLYNERYVAERAITAACAMDYPLDRLQIQVLDDSTDDTALIAQRAVRSAQANGVRIERIERQHRAGYKAGALANGMQSASGEFIAVFDADFVPSPDFLNRVLIERHVFGDPLVGFVQTRWSFLNRDDNALTRAQGLLLDMHFIVDQSARSQAGMTMNFNGSGGVWRRAAIEAAGGWRGDTLTEDLDLSYRAQLAGWRGAYLLDIECPGELPDSLLSFKRQQARWARGSAQCLRALAAQVMRSAMPLLIKAGALLHLSGYVVSLFVLALALVSPLLLLDSAQPHTLPVWLSAFSAVAVAPLLAMGIAQAAQRQMRRFLLNLPVTVLLGIGMSLTNSAAVISGLFSAHSGEFVRTPKLESSAVRDTAYALRADWTLIAEIVISLYLLAMCAMLAVRGAWASVFLILMYAVGFCGVALVQLLPALLANERERAQRRQRQVESGLRSVK